MKTARRENPNRWATRARSRVHGAAGKNRSRSIKWAAKQEKFQPQEMCFFLTSTFLELIRTSLKWATALRSRLFRNRMSHHRLIGDRYPQHQTVFRSEVAVPVAFGRGEVFNELYVSGI